jgi:hypothetical protein
VDYNKFYPDIFISCSADWRVKIWEDTRRWDVTILMFLGNAVKLYSVNMYAGLVGQHKWIKWLPWGDDDDDTILGAEYFTAHFLVSCCKKIISSFFILW